MHTFLPYMCNEMCSSCVYATHTPRPVCYLQGTAIIVQFVVQCACVRACSCVYASDRRRERGDIHTYMYISVRK